MNYCSNLAMQQEIRENDFLFAIRGSHFSKCELIVFSSWKTPFVSSNKLTLSFKFNPSHVSALPSFLFFYFKAIFIEQLNIKLCLHLTIFGEVECNFTKFYMISE